MSIEVSARHRASMLEDIITYYGKGSHAIVFTNSKAECDELADGQTFKTLTSQVCTTLGLRASVRKFDTRSNCWAWRPSAHACRTGFM